MDKKRLMELAGVESLNESAGNDMVIKHIGNIIIHVLKTDDFFEGYSAKEMDEPIREMIQEQFEVLAEDLAPAIRKYVHAAMKAK